MMERLPPQSLEYEQSILAGMLIDREICEQAIEALKAALGDDYKDELVSDDGVMAEARAAI